MAVTAEKIEDASARLQRFATLNNCVDTAAITALVNTLQDARASDVMETLWELLRYKLQLKESERRLFIQ